MPIYNQTIKMFDVFSRKKNRQYRITAADFISARAIADANLQAVTNMIDGGVYEEVLGEVANIISIAGINSNVDTGLSIQMSLGFAKTGTVTLPMPLTSLFNPDGSLDLTDPLVVAFTTQFTNGQILISDGEIVQSIIKGQLDK